MSRVAVVDINNDGLMDLYVAASMLPDAAKRENLSYVNQVITKTVAPSLKNWR